LDFSLTQIEEILNQQGFDPIAALQEHRKAIQEKVNRLNLLIKTIDSTIENLKGQKEMSQSQYFNGFSEEQQAEYEKEATVKWNPEIVQQSSRKWKALNKMEKEALMKRGEEITLALRDAMPRGTADAEVQHLVGEWQQHISFFYDCTDEILLGLGKMYVEDARFKAFYDRIDANLAEFLSEAIRIYCAERGVV
jgi:MerR family transcriptional regulator, thiopeptide resistance regulator